MASFVVMIQSLSGAVMWLSVRRCGHIPLIEALGMGVAFGTLTGLIGAQATVMIGAGGIGWLLPLVFAITLTILRRVKPVSLAARS